MKIRIIHCDRWFLPKEYWGITLYPFIFMNTSHPMYRNEFDVALHHEEIHIEQIRREGFFKFYLKYLWYNFKYGYIGNPYEKEAYDRQRELQRPTE